jgi:hypothetical protein
MYVASEHSVLVFWAIEATYSETSRWNLFRVLVGDTHGNMAMVSLFSQVSCRGVYAPNFLFHWKQVAVV